MAKQINQFQSINSTMAKGRMATVIEVDDNRIQRGDAAEFRGVQQAFRSRNHQISLVDKLGMYKVGGWHGLGEVIDEGLSGSEAADRFLGWHVEEHQVFAEIDGVKSPMPAKVTLRSDTREVLGMVGLDYCVMQNRAIGQFADAIVGADAAVTMETCGSLLGGRKVFLLVRVPKEVRVGKNGDDVSVPYLMLASGHDGSMAFSVLWTMQRVVCNNSNTMALAGIDGRVERGDAFRIRHTSSAIDAIEDARRVLGIAAKGVQQFGDAANELASHFLKPDGRTQYFRNCYAAIYGEIDDENKEQAEAKTERRDRIVAEWAALADAPQNTIDGIGGSAWAAYNAVTEWMDWNRSEKLGEDRRAHSVLLGTASVAKRKALQAALATV